MSATEILPVEVLVETGTYEGGWKFAASAECENGEDAENVVATARLLWDEAYNRIGGCRRRLTVCREVIRGESGFVNGEWTPGLAHAEGVIYRTEVRP